MERLLYNISQVLGISILHSLWQGLLVYLVLRLLLLVMPALSAGRKYYLLLAALFSISLWFAYTLFVEAKDLDWGPATTAFATPLPVGAPAITAYHNTTPALLESYKIAFFHTIKVYLPYLSVLYAIGLFINLIYLGFAWNKIRHIKRDLIPTGILQETVDRLSKRLNLFKYIQVSFSEMIDVPCVIGYIKPILLLPISISIQLSDTEIEAILLHELLHIRNNDYLVNLIQQAANVLLFFNPFSYRISRMITIERENRCDDNVVEITRDPLIYAQALLKLEQSRQISLNLAMAATSEKYYLLTRIDRIMKTKKPIVNTKHLVLAVVLFIGSIGSIAWLNPEIKDGRIVSKHGSQAIHHLTALVQKAITGEKTTVVQASKPQQAASIAISLKDNILSDTLSNSNHIRAAAKDTFNYTAMKKLYSSPEWEKLSIYITLYRDSLHKVAQYIPELTQLQRAQKALDSAIRSKTNNYFVKFLLPVAQQASEKYRNSPELKQKQAEVNRLNGKIFYLMIRDPEEKKYQEDSKRRKDSLTNAIGPYQKTGDNRLQWLQLGETESIQSELARQKLLNRPDVKPINDSLIAARKLLREGPAWEEYEKTMDSISTINREKMKAGTNDPDVVKYQAEVSALKKRIHDNSDYQKYLNKMNAAIKKYDDEIKKLHWQ